MRIIAWLLVGLLPAVASAAGPVERRLHPSQIEASSFLWNSWNKFQENYHPNYIADDDPKTAWVEGADGIGQGEWVRLPVSAVEGVTKVRLRIRNGYHKSKPLYFANARPSKLRVHLLPGKTTKTFTLKDEMDWQELVMEAPGIKMSGVELFVDAATPGKKYKDLCISDVQIFVTATTAEDPAFEKHKFDALVAWKAERVEAATLFKQAAKEDMPLAPQYQMTQRTRLIKGKEVEPISADALRDRVKERLPAEVQKEIGSDADWQPVTVDVQIPRKIPAIDGLAVWAAPEFDMSGMDCWSYCADESEEDQETPKQVAGRRHCEEQCELSELTPKALRVPAPNKLAFFKVDWLGIAEAQHEISDADMIRRTAEAEDGSSTACRVEHAYAARYQTGAGGRKQVSALAIRSCYLEQTRESEEAYVVEEVLVYDRDGRLRVIDGPQPYKNARNYTVFAWRQRPDKTWAISGGTATNPYFEETYSAVDTQSVAAK